jgi:micrococcal nuclease
MKTAMIVASLMVFCLGGFIACSGNSGGSEEPTAGAESTSAVSSTSAETSGREEQVARVVDGDTLELDNETHEKVRLIGVDTPETNNPQEGDCVCYGPEAKKYTTSLLQGKTIRLEFDAEKADMYGRTLAYAYLLPDGIFVNAELIRGGYAYAFPYGKNLLYEDYFASLEANAKKLKKGLWNPNTCPNPEACR